MAVINQKKENLAIVYSIKQRDVQDIIPFEIQDGKMIFAEHKPPKRGFSSKKQEAPAIDIIEPVPFSEGIAVFNQQRGGWLTIISYETHTQLPIVSGSNATLAKMLIMERNLESRVSRLKSSSGAIKSYIETSTPAPQLGNVQIVGLVLLFVGIIAIAYALNSVVDAVGKVDATLTALKNVQIIGGGSITILLKPMFRKKGKQPNNKSE